MTTVRIPDDAPYQVLPSLTEQEYSSLENDIIEHGIQDEVVVDEDGIPIDGYTRAEIGLENEIEIPTKVKEGLSEQEKRDLAYRLNLNRRHLKPGKKKEIVEQYLMEDWNGDNSDEWYDTVASKLGVGSSTVRNAFSELRQNGKFAEFSIFSKEEEQSQVKDYLDENPDASNREVAENIEADVSHATVGNWRNEWEKESETEETQEAEEGKTEVQEDEEDPVSFKDFSNQPDTEEVDKPTDVVSDEDEEESQETSSFTQQIESVDTVDVELEGELEAEFELPEKTYERAESFASDFGFDSVEDFLLVSAIPEYLESEEGTTTLIDTIESKVKARGY